MITNIYKVQHYPLSNIKSLGRNDANLPSLNVLVDLGDNSC